MVAGGWHCLIFLVQRCFPWVRAGKKRSEPVPTERQAGRDRVRDYFARNNLAPQGPNKWRYARMPHELMCGVVWDKAGVVRAFSLKTEGRGGVGSSLLTPPPLSMRALPLAFIFSFPLALIRSLPADHHRAFWAFCYHHRQFSRLHAGLRRLTPRSSSRPRQRTT